MDAWITKEGDPLFSIDAPHTDRGGRMSFGGMMHGRSEAQVESRGAPPPESDAPFTGINAPYSALGAPLKSTHGG